MKILYIGGTGEISYPCVRRSVTAGHDVAVFNRGNCTEPLPSGARQITGDMRDASAYAALGRGNFDVVCQFRAFRTETVERDVELFSGRCGQYVFISSASAYLKPPAHYVITEDTPRVNPYWPYSSAKAEIEAYLMARHAAGELAVTIVRPSHTYRRHFPTAIMGGDDCAWRMRNGRPIVVLGDGTSLWTLTHSNDFAVPFVGLLGNARALGEAFHITNHMHATTWNEIYTGIGKALGVEPELVHVPTDTLLRYCPDWAGPLLGDKTWSVLFDNSKVMSVAGEFTQTVELAEGLAQTAEFYLRDRADRFKPDARTHTLLDRIAAQQKALGSQGERA